MGLSRQTYGGFLNTDVRKRLRFVRRSLFV